MVAHDQNVVALTLAAADGRPLPRWHPGRAPRHASAQRPAAPVLAVRRSPRHRCLPDRRAPDPRRRRRIHRGARRVAGRRRGDDARSAQRLPVDGSRLRLAGAAVPVHRRRHRHHADSADAGARAAPRRRLVDGVRRPQLSTACRSSTRSAASAIGSRSAPTTSAGSRPRRNCSATAPTARPSTPAGPRRC